ncbi:MAG: hypothetical protein ACTS5F_00915 [Candidatus Hodgkinia cicadicola]
MAKRFSTLACANAMFRWNVTGGRTFDGSERGLVRLATSMIAWERRLLQRCAIGSCWCKL